MSRVLGSHSPSERPRTMEDEDMGVQIQDSLLTRSQQTHQSFKLIYDSDMLVSLEDHKIKGTMW